MTESKKKKARDSAEEEVEAMMEILRNEPGIEELMAISGQLAELRKMTNWYLDMAAPRPLSVSSNTSE